MKPLDEFYELEYTMHGVISAVTNYSPSRIRRYGMHVTRNTQKSILYMFNGRLQAHPSQRFTGYIQTCTKIPSSVPRAGRQQ